MITFIVSVLALVLGYLFYGAFVERVFGVDGNRQTPAYSRQDGVDYIPMPLWKVFLIQFLNRILLEIGRKVHYLEIIVFCVIVDCD